MSGPQGPQGFQGPNHCQDIECQKVKDYFDFDYYRLHNPDVTKVYKTNADLWKHWVNFGYNECRIHRFTTPCKVCQECCPNECEVVVKKKHVIYDDPSTPPAPPSSCCPDAQICCGCNC